MKRTENLGNKFNNIVGSVLVTIFLSVLFISCDNFLSGSYLKDIINSAIEYQNAESFKVKFIGENGKISPAGNVEYKVTDKTELIFSPDDEYDFVKWTILDGKTEKPLKEEEWEKIISIEDLYAPETTVKFLNNQEIIIKSVCALRPSVISKTPQTQANGVFRSVRVWIMFDMEMDESSIYYSEKECTELKNNGYTLIEDTDSSEKRKGKCYGYWDGEHGDSIVYKNISITNKKTGENLLECFGAPYFDSDINDVLVIPTKKRFDKATNKNESLAPSSGTYVFVELNKNFSYKEKNYKENENKFVTMKGSEKWSYLVNGNADITAPSWTKLEISGKNKENSSRKLEQYSVPSNETEYLSTYIKDNKISVNAVISDGESGPSKIRVKYKRIKNEKNQNVIENSNEVILYPVLNGNDGTVNETIDCETWSDGIYELSFIAEDENGNESVYTPPASSEIETTYILKNNMSPALTIEENRNSLTAAEISVTNDVTSDFYESASVTAKNVDDESAAPITESVTGSSVNIAGLKGFKHYQYTYEVRDIFGRTYSIESSVDRKAPEEPTTYTVPFYKIEETTVEDKDGQVIVYWKTPSDADVIRIGYEEYGKSKVAPEIEISDNVAGGMSRSIPLYRNGKRYTFDIYAVDFSGNVSEPYSVSTKNYINSKGNVVFNNEEITYTSLAPVLTETTIFNTISKPSYARGDYRGAFTDARGENVTLDPYEMGNYLVTNCLYNKVAGESLNGLTSNERWPICGTTYYHAVVFCNKLSIALGFKPCYSFGSHTVDEAYSWNFWKVNGRDMDLDNAFKDLKCDFGANGFRLPTELEWECCARGADETKWEWKNCYAAKTDAVWGYYYKNGGVECKKSTGGIDYLNSLPSSTTSSIIYIDNWLDYICPTDRSSAYNVGSYTPTSTGQYDMSGLLWEWCWDTYQDITSGSSIYGKVNYSEGKVQGNLKTSSYDAVRADRIIKGGYYHDTNTTNFMVFYRNHVTPHTDRPKEVGWTQAGFRLCRTRTIE